MGLILDLSLDRWVHHAARAAAWHLKDQLSVPVVAALIAAGLLAWLIAGIRLRGKVLLLWLLVPLFTVAAAICIAGPGRLFNKRGHEGRVVFLINPSDAVTTLDVIGLTLATTGALLALALLAWRLRTAMSSTTP